MLRIIARIRRFLPLAIVIVLCVAGNALADLQMPNLLSQVIDVGVAQGDMAYIVHTGFQMLGVALFGVLCTICMGFCSAWVAAGFGMGLRQEMFRKVEGFSLAEFDQFGTSSLITRTTNDINQMQHFTMMFLRSMISAPITAIGGVWMAYRKSSRLAMLVLIAMPVIVLLVITVSRHTIPITRVMQQKLDRVNQVLREQLTGVRVIRAFNTDAHEESRFDEANKDLCDTSIHMQRIMSVLQPLVMLVLNLTSVALVWSGAVQVSLGHMMVGDIMAVVQYVSQILMSMMMLSMIFIRIPRASASAERINAVLDATSAIEDGPLSESPQGEHGTLEFRDVTFRYPGGEEPILQHISFVTRPGQTVAIIGGTGSGKTSLLNLIPRFYDPEEGTILVDGVDIRQYTQKALRQKIGFVPQKSLLFNGSIADNIRQGKPDAENEEIIHAAQVAQAEEFILTREEGYNAPVSQSGTNLSGGQKQRLSIARAIVRKPEIYIFDDSFSALDFQTDAALRRALSSETEQATVLIVAQRVATIMEADIILVLEDGRIIGTGAHKELLQTCEVYREIVLSQLSEEEVAQ